MANPRAQALLAQNRQAMTGGFPGTRGPQPAGQQEQMSPLFDAWDENVGLQPGWAMQVYSAAIGLPRTYESFRSGQFSPLEPIYPVPIDIGEEPSGRPRPRRWQAPIGWNLPVGTPGSEGLKLANFQFLRELAEPVSVLRSCIEMVKIELLGLLDDLDPIEPTPTAMLDMQGNSSKRRDFEKRKAELMEFLENPDPDQYDSMEDWLNALWEDSLVLDSVGIYLQPAGSGKNAKNGKGNGPLGSDVGALALVDGSTLRPLLDEWSARPRPPEPYLQQYIWGVPRMDLMDMINLGPDATLEDIKALNPVLEEITETVDQWSGDQCLYFVTNPRTNTPYGFGPVEQGMLVASMIWARQTWQWSFYSSGSLPSVFLDPGESIATAEEARQLQEAINMLGGDIAGMHQVIVLPPGAKAMEQKPVDLTSQFDEWSTALMCMPFGLNIGDLGITPKVAAMESPQSAKAQAMMAAEKTASRAVKPRAQRLKRKVLDRLIQGKFGQQDMQWTWGLEEEGENKDELVKQTVSLFHGTITTLDEARIAIEMDPIGIEGVTDVPMVFTATGAVPLHASIEMALNPPAPPAPALPPGQDAAGGAGAKPKQPPPKALPPGTPPGNAPPGSKPKPKPSTSAARSKPEIGEEEGAEAVQSAPPKKHTTSEGKTTELRSLRRFLKGGGPIAEFVPKALSPYALRAGTHVAGAEAALAAVVKAQNHLDSRTAALSRPKQVLVASLGSLAGALAAGNVSQTGFVDQAGGHLSDALGSAYSAGTLAAAEELGLDPADIVDMGPDAVAARLAELAPSLDGFASDVLGGVSAAELANRVAMWADQTTPAYEQGYVAGAPDDGTDTYIVWHLGDTKDPCELCIGRDGQQYSEDEINEIGYPGDGDFGGETCRGGPRCGCWLEFVSGGATQDQTQDPSAAREQSLAGAPDDLGLGAYADLADTAAAATADLPKFSDDQARDEHGRWASGGARGDSPSTNMLRAARDAATGEAHQRLQNAWGASSDGDSAVRMGDNGSAAAYYGLAQRELPTDAVAVASALHAAAAYHSAQGKQYAVACPNCGSMDLFMIPPDFESVRCDNCHTTFDNEAQGEESDVDKDFSLSGGAGGVGSPLASGFVPFDLTGPPGAGKPRKRKKRKKVERFDDADAAKRAFRFYDKRFYEVVGDTIYRKAIDPPIPATVAAAPSVVAAGLALRSESTGRVLLQQRTLADEDARPDAAAGTWEWPGGGIDDGETPWAAAVREFGEETGCTLPPSAQVVGTYVCPAGTYQTFVVAVPDENGVGINSHDDGAPMNPDDPDRDCPEVAAWFDINDLHGMPSLRPELAADLPSLLPVLRQPLTATKSALLFKDWDESAHPRDEHGRFIGGGDTGSVEDGRVHGGDPGQNIPATGPRRTQALGTRTVSVAALTAAVAQSREYTEFQVKQLGDRMVKMQREQVQATTQDGRAIMALHIAAIIGGILLTVLTGGLGLAAGGLLVASNVPAVISEIREYKFTAAGDSASTTMAQDVAKMFGVDQFTQRISDHFNQRGEPT